MTEMEKSIIGMISSAGQSKAKAFEALKKVRTGEYDEARKLLEEAREADLQAHTIFPPDQDERRSMCISPPLQQAVLY